MPFGVYVHIPFCAQRCDYCAFATWTDRGHLIDEYVDAVRKDIARHVDDMPVADSIFFGGGTPSLIDGKLLTSIIADIPRTADAEVTVECNPDTVTHELYETYANGGVNRVSLGVQSAVPHVLSSLGRTHDQQNVANAVKIANEVGIERVNLDIIYGAKGESVTDWRTTLETVLAMAPQPLHVSAYGLTVEAGTPLSKDPDRFPDDDDQAEKYQIADALLNEAGLQNYEVSNWAAPGEECRHNILYWQQENYQGFGCAAHSHKDGRRYWNIHTPDRYIKAVNENASVVTGEETLDEETRRFEGLELALRMRDGVPVNVLPVDDLEGFVEVKGDRAVLTQAGRLMANDIATRFL